MRRGYRDGGLGMNMVAYIPLNRSRYTDDQSGNGNNAVSASPTFGTVELSGFGTYGDTRQTTALRFLATRQGDYINKIFRIELDFYIDSFVIDSNNRYLLDGSNGGPSSFDRSYISIYYKNSIFSSYLVYSNIRGNLEYYGMDVPYNMMSGNIPYRISMERRKTVLCITLVDMIHTSVVQRAVVPNVPISANGAMADWLGIGRRTNGRSDIGNSTPDGTYLKDFKLYY